MPYTSKEAYQEAKLKGDYDYKPYRRHLLTLQHLFSQLGVYFALDQLLQLLFTLRAQELIDFLY